MQELAVFDFEFAFNCFNTLARLDGCRAGDCTYQVFGSQFFSGAARAGHSGCSIEKRQPSIALASIFKTPLKPVGAGKPAPTGFSVDCERM